jgi:hypothetical protein
MAVGVTLATAWVMMTAMNAKTTAEDGGLPEETRIDPKRPEETRRDPKRPGWTRRNPKRPEETRRSGSSGGHPEVISKRNGLG